MRGYTRISGSPIRSHSAIYSPNVVVVLDPTLLDIVDVCDGIADDGIVIVNTGMSPDEVRSKLSAKNVNVFTVDASRISIEEIGRDIPNTPMIGALVRATGLLELETIYTDLRKKFGKKFSEKIVQGNIDAIKRAYEEVKS